MGPAAMTRPRDDLPDAPGLEDLGPLGSLVRHEGAWLRIPQSMSRFDPRRAVPVEDAALLREAARCVAEGLVFTSRWTHMGPRERVIAWVEGALGPPRATSIVGGAEQLLWFDGAVLTLLKSAVTLACASRGQLAALIVHPLASGLSLSPARYSYESRPARLPLGRHLGRVSSIDPEILDFYETEGGCVIQSVAHSHLETELLMKPGGVIATPPPAPEHFPRARPFGEWQPGLRRPEALHALLREHRAPDPLARAVLEADELVGGFCGRRGIRMVAPWAACLILPETVPEFWSTPRHPYDGSWFLGWATITQIHTSLYLDEHGWLWASWQEPSDDEVQMRRLGPSVGRWFERQLFLLEHGYASEATCRTVEALPPGLALHEDLSDEGAQVYVDGDAVWLVEEIGVQRMSRRVANVAEVLAAVVRFHQG